MFVVLEFPSFDQRATNCQQPDYFYYQHFLSLSLSCTLTSSRSLGNAPSVDKECQYRKTCTVKERAFLHAPLLK